MLVAADYPFLEVLWSMLVFFAWVAWFWLLISIAIDVFRRHDIGGGKKAVWLVFMLFVPFIGVLSYLIVNNEGMTKRRVEEAQAQRTQFDDYVKSVADTSGPAAEIDKAKQLLDSGAISQPEFEAIKAKALAT
jgi:hypothetical protein